MTILCSATYRRLPAFRAWRDRHPRNGCRWRSTSRVATVLRATAPHVFATGTNLVVGLDDRLILKIFPPLLRGQFVSERARWRSLRGRLRVPIPEIVVEGERDGWPYLVITRLSGSARRGGLAGAAGSSRRSACWPDRRDHRARCSARRSAQLARIEPRWDVFMRGQIEGCRARHERLGLPQKFLDGLDDLLRDAATLIPLDAPPVILTGEYIPENFLLSRDGDGVAAVGADRFRRRDDGMGRIRPARVPSAFMTAGMPRRVRSLFDGFGYSRADITPALKRRLMALMLLHRVSDPVRHICIEGWQEKAPDLQQLQDLLWPI